MKKRISSIESRIKLNIFDKIKLYYFAKKFKLNYKKLSINFKEERKTYNILKEEFSDKLYNSKNKHKNINFLKIYNPGGSSDLITLLIILDTISPKNINLKIIFQDIRDHMHGIIEEIKKYTNVSILKVKKSNNKHIITGFYKDKIIQIIYYLAPIENLFPSEIKSGYDIYYERAFQFFRSNNNEFIYNITKHLHKGGLLISDYGFELNKETKKQFKKVENVPKQYGLYNNFQIWKKLKKNSI